MCVCSRGALDALSLGGGQYVYLWFNGTNLGQILGDYQRYVELLPIIGFFYGMIGLDFITNLRLRKRSFFLI